MSIVSGTIEPMDGIPWFRADLLNDLINKNSLSLKDLIIPICWNDLIIGQKRFFFANVNAMSFTWTFNKVTH